MAELITYREAVSRAIAQEMRRDTSVVFLGAAMGAAMTGMRSIAEIMFTDSLATCWDFEQKSLYPTKGEIPGGEIVDELRPVVRWPSGRPRVDGDVAVNEP